MCCAGLLVLSPGAVALIRMLCDPEVLFKLSGPKSSLASFRTGSQKL